MSKIKLISTKEEKHTVLSFDICSSTDILEDLHRTENIKKWSSFLVLIKDYLRKQAGELPFKMYNFTGDGWILLFEYDLNGKLLLNFLESFCKFFKNTFDNKIMPVLESPPEVIGVTFGMERGNLIKIIMNQRSEYIGRAINVACRLQTAIKDNDKHPEYKILMTKQLYNQIKKDIPKKSFVEVKRNLRNIAGGNKFLCMKKTLLKTSENIKNKITLRVQK